MSRRGKRSRFGRRGVALLAGAVAVAGAFAAVRCLFSGEGWDGPPSDHFDGKEFRNLDAVRHGGFDVVKWQATRDPGEWPDWREVSFGPAPPDSAAKGTMRVTWINHATTLIQLDGVNILTDPIWSYRCSPVEWAGPRRHRPPGISFNDLPKIDAVFVSHNHYDHMDLASLRNLEDRDHPRFLVGLGNRGTLASRGIDVRVTEMDWWDSIRIRDVELHFVPARHFSARGLCDRNQTLWGGLFASGTSGSVYFAGDTGYGRHFEMIREHLGEPDVALLPIGAFRPRWFMKPVHIDPADAIEAHRVIGAKRSVPIHWGTFPLGDDGEREAAELLAELTRERKVEGFEILEMGESIETGAVGERKREAAVASEG